MQGQLPESQLPELNEQDLKGPCYRLNRNFELIMETVQSGGQSAGVAGGSTTPGPPGPPGPGTSCQVAYAPGAVVYTGSIIRNANEKFGEHVSILDFGAICDGTTDNAPFIRAAYQAAVAKGGCEVYIPGSLTGQPYLVKTFILIDGTVPVTFVGDGRASVLKRGASITAGSGMFDLQAASDVTFRDFLVDGGFDGAPTGVDFASITGGDPMIDLLTQESSFWIHGGDRLTWDGVFIEHGGGYAILLDARTVDITNVQIVDCAFRNNRQYLFGTGGDLHYGSWTGGIFYKNDGVSHTTAVHALSVERCLFERNTGNCVWGHGYGILAQHKAVKIDGNVFIDCGLDGILHGNTVGGSANDNHFRRIGYICVDDTSPSTPKYLANAFATAIDTTGVVKDCTYNNNSMCSVNGDFINGDGFSHGSIANNVFLIPAAGTPEYTEDQIGSMGVGGGCLSQGIVMNNSINDPDADSYVNISGNSMYGIPGVNIGAYGTRYSYIVGNQIYCPVTMLSGQFPINLGNVGSGSAQRAYGNVVARNSIWREPAAAAPCVFEDGSFAAFSGTDANYVVGNTIFCSNGKAYEFKPDANTISRSEFVLSSNDPGVTANASHSFQREGHSESSALKIYYYEGVNRYQHAQFQAYWSTGHRAPVFNVSEAGTDGAFTTGARTSLPFSDTVVTGRLYADGFLVLTDSTFTYPNDPAADVLPAAYGLLRFNSTTHAIEQSVAVAGGHRVWSPIGGGGSTNYWTLSGSLLYPNSVGYSVLIGRTTDDGSGDALQLTGKMSLTGNNVAPFAASIRLDTNAAQGQLNGPAPGGDSVIIDNQGFEGNFVRVKSHLDYFDWTCWGTGTSPLPAHTLQLRDSANDVVYQYTVPPGGSYPSDSLHTFNGTVNISQATIDFAGVAGIRKTGLTTMQWSNDGVSWNNFGANFWTLSGTLLYPSSTADQVLIGRTTDDGTAAALQVTGKISITGNAAANESAYIIIDTNVAAGQVAPVGADKKDATVIDNQGMEGNFIRAKSHLDYFDWTCWGTGTSPLPAHQFQIRDSSNSVILHYAATSTVANGSWAYTGSITASSYLNTGSTVAFGGVDGLRRSGGALQWSDDGATWFWFNQLVTSVSGGAGISVVPSTGAVTVTNVGVIALTGTANQVNVNHATGAVTISGPQDLANGSTPRFAGLLVNQANDGSGYTVQVNGGIEVNNAGSNILSKGTGPNSVAAGYSRVIGGLTVWDGGGVTSHTGYWVDANQVITSGGTFNGTGGVSTSGSVISSGFFINAGGFYTGQTVTVQGSFIISGAAYSNLFFRGGILVSYS